MPLYEYECEVCGEQFECLAAWSAADAQHCPKCGQPARRMVSGFASGASCAPAGGG